MSDYRPAFARLRKQRDVLKLNSEEIFRAGYEACMVDLKSNCTMDTPFSKPKFEISEIRYGYDWTVAPGTPYAKSGRVEHVSKPGDEDFDSLSDKVVPF